MGEAQFFPSSTASGFPVLVNGTEVQVADLALLGQTSGLADDRVFAELLRLSPYDANNSTNPVYKGIMPFGFRPNCQSDFSPSATVVPSGLGDGSIWIYPFRAVVGSRRASVVGASSSPDSRLANWRDIRSGIFVGPTALTNGFCSVQKVQLAPNSSGSPRWDLVYATISVDAPSNSIQRRVKDPNSSNPTAQAVYQYLAQPVSVTVLQGTPGTTPTIPAIPADGDPYYHIPICAVFVPASFDGAEAITPQQIRDQVMPIMLYSTSGVSSLRPATGNTDWDGTYQQDVAFTWPTSSPFRSALFLPPSMVGGEQILIQMDAVTTGHHSHPDGWLVDSSIDWRHRYFQIMAYLSSGNPFASTPTVPSGVAMPYGPQPYAPTTSIDTPDFRLAHSMWPDSGTEANIYVADNSHFPSLVASGGSIGFYVNMTDGAMFASLTGNPGVRLFAWVTASAQMGNF
jgi:hypothetical protein